MGIQCAASVVEIADGDFFDAQIRCDLIGILQRIRRETVADGKNLQNTVAVGIPFVAGADFDHIRFLCGECRCGQQAQQHHQGQKNADRALHKAFVHK